MARRQAQSRSSTGLRRSTVITIRPASGEGCLSGCPPADTRAATRMAPADHRSRWRRRGHRRDCALAQADDGLGPRSRLCRVDRPGSCRAPALRSTPMSILSATRSLLEAVASCLTEMFSAGDHRGAGRGLAQELRFHRRRHARYFTPRLTQAPIDVAFALGYVKEHADTPEKQGACPRHVALLNATYSGRSLMRCTSLMSNRVSCRPVLLSPASPRNDGRA